MEFGERLKQAREKKGMTQQTLADRLFVTRQTVSRWENGVRYPDILTVRKLSEILEISLDDRSLTGESETDCREISDTGKSDGRAAPDCSLYAGSSSLSVPGSGAFVGIGDRYGVYTGDRRGFLGTSGNGNMRGSHTLSEQANLWPGR